MARYRTRPRGPRQQPIAMAAQRSMTRSPSSGRQARTTKANKNSDTLGQRQIFAQRNANAPTWRLEPAAQKMQAPTPRDTADPPRGQSNSHPRNEVKSAQAQSAWRIVGCQQLEADVIRKLGDGAKMKRIAKIGCGGRFIRDSRQGHRYASVSVRTMRCPPMRQALCSGITRSR